MKHYERAREMFKKAVGMDPNDPNQERLVGNLADTYRWLGRQERASSTYGEAIALALTDLGRNPKKASTMGDLALYYAKTGEYGRALVYIRRARDTDKSDVNLMYAEADSAHQN
jgi:tetratricopeptide (TPR) repeat protein